MLNLGKSYISEQILPPLTKVDPQIPYPGRDTGRDLETRDSR